MRKTKGFIHMVETILVSLIVLIALPMILYPFQTPTDWENRILSFNGRDFLSVSDKVYNNKESYAQNLMEKDENQIHGELQRLMGNRSRVINYGMKSVGPMKNNIRVGFNCTSSPNCNETMAIYLRKILRPTFVNGREIDFQVIPFSYDEFGKYDLDVIFLNDTDQLDKADSHTNKIKNFLGNGGGVVEFVDSQAVANTHNSGGGINIQEDIFGLGQGPGPAAGGNLTFVNTDNPKKPNYEIQKYFYGVGSYVRFNVTGFGNFTVWGKDHLVKKNDTNCNTIAIDSDLSSPGFEEINLNEEDTFTMNYGGEYNFSVEEIDNANCSYASFNFLRDFPPPGEESYKFKNISNIAPPITPGDGNQNRIVLETSGGANAVIVNETKGRAVWLDSEMVKGDDTNALVRSSVIWSAENKYWNVLKTVSGKQVKVSYFVSQGEEFHEPYWIEMNLWYIY